MYVKRLILEKEQGRKKKISGTIWVERNTDRGRKIVKAWLIWVGEEHRTNEEKNNK